MITKDEIDKKASELGVGTSNVQRDYIFGWLLSGIAQNESLRRQLILTGGNCFRKAYVEGARFSGDLDFSTQQEINPDRLLQEINAVCDFVSDRTGVGFDTSRTDVRLKRWADESDRVFEARVYFRGFYGEEPYHISGKMDVNELDRLHLPVQERPIIHSYSDRDKCLGTIRCVKLEELLANKLKALLQRQHSPDLYDFVYSVFFQNDLEVQRSEIIRTFLRKTIYRPSPAVAKNLLLQLPFQVLRGFWETYLVCPRQSLISFEQAEEAFRSIIEEIFAPAHAGPGRAFSAGLFFPAAYRSKLMQAGRERRLLRMVYRGLERLIEPYSLKYKVRRTDGVGQEYLYAFDPSGGTSGTFSIKAYTNDKISALELTDRSFEPRYPIELSKAGDRADKDHFPSRGPAMWPRAARAGRRTPSFLAPQEYRVRCPYCDKTFRRARPTQTKLNKHKDRFGNRCTGSGQTGYLV